MPKYTEKDFEKQIRAKLNPEQQPGTSLLQKVLRRTSTLPSPPRVFNGNNKQG